MGSERFVDHASDFTSQFRGRPFVGIHSQNPLTGRKFERCVSLVGEIVEGAHSDHIGPTSGNFFRLILTGFIHHHNHFIGPTDGMQAGGKVVGLVFGKDQYGNCGFIARIHSAVLRTNAIIK